MSTPPTPPVVDALYRAMLGRSPDAEGAAHWVTAPSVDAVIEGIAATDTYRRRVLQAATGFGAESPFALRSALRLTYSAGLAQLGDEAPGADAFGALPLAEVTRGLDRPRVQVLGPYAAQLAEELPDATAGLDAEGPCDVLVTTEPESVDALRFVFPDLLADVRLRLACPAPADFTHEASEVEADVARRRGALHALGFIEVLRVHRRRHGDVTTTLDATYTTPDPGTQHRVEHARPNLLDAPRWTWLIANRVPLHDRA